MRWQFAKSTLLKAVTFLAPFAVVIALSAAIEPLRASAPPHGTWVDGQGGSCELACKGQRRDAWRTGHYKNTETHYTICRAPLDALPDLASRPGFQHQPGSPNVCKIQSFDAQRRYDCLCH